MLHTVEIQSAREDLTTAMAEIRLWLDARRVEPDAFRYVTNEDHVTFRLEFKFESEAAACAQAFGGQLGRIG